MIVTTHAATRYCERIDPAATLGEAEAEIRKATRAILVAASMGCRVVKLGSGTRLIVDGVTVVTVYPRDFRITRAVLDNTRAAQRKHAYAERTSA